MKNKKIIFLKVHPIFLACKEQEWVTRDYRERWIIRQTKDLGYDAKLFLLSDSKCIWTYPDEVEVTFFPVDNKSVSKNKHTSTLMLNRLLEEKPDLIVFKGMNYTLSSWILNQMDVKFIFIVGGYCIDKNLSKASCILAETQEQIEQYFQDIPSVVFPKTIDLSLFKPDNKKEFDIINVGSFEHRKNQQALVNLTYKYKTALIGDGPDYNKIRSAVHPDTYMPKNVSVEEVARLLSKSKIMVHPSIWEGFPRVLIESMACGVPFVALSKTIQGIVKHNVHGLLVEDVDLAADKLLNDPELYFRLSSECRQLAINNFSKEATIPILQEVFGYVL